MVRALILAPFSSRYLGRLRQRLEVAYESWLDTGRLHDPDQLASRLRDEAITILVIESDFVFEEIFQEAKALKLVGICRSITAHVDVEAATRHGVTVVNTPSRNAAAVAEHTLGLMLSLARKIPFAHQYVVQGRWQNPAEPYRSMRGIELGGRTVGIIGLGAIGRKVAQVSIALGMEVLAHDPYAKSTPRGVTLAELDDLMARSDFISVHVPPAPATEGMLDRRRLALMKPTAYLVSTSDASIIDEEALAEALRQGRMAGAALDVFETHPISPNSPLLALPNVVLTPHLGGATEETVERHSQMMTKDILRFLAGRRPKNLVNPEVWDRRGQ